MSKPLVLRAADIEPFDRGTGVVTLPFVGKWNGQDNCLTTGITAFAAGTAIPLHTHNVEETVLVLEGEATAIIGDDRYDLLPDDATWIPPNVPHSFMNRGTGEMRIYWVYGGHNVTRTNCQTGKTVEHLSPEDRGAARVG